MASDRADEIGAAAERAFRQLVAEKPYRSITVMDICERAHLSRKAFYSRFSNKDDIVSVIFKRDVMKPLERINAVFERSEVQKMGPLVYIKMYQALFDNCEFYTSLVRPLGTGGEVFVKAATDAIYDYDLPILASLAAEFDEVETDYVAYFFASSQAMLMRKWIAEGMNLSVEKLAGLYLRMTESFWLDSDKAAR